MTITMVWGDKMKITIDNEEVLCDKNFTIEEEMLNTSSVILNNVYPATWEQDKDYVSRFYYPKDYSKCKIFNEIVHPTTREDVEGTSFSINVDTTKQYQVQTLKGQTSQSGTPTPTSPQPINITTGRQVVSVIGRNYFDNSKPYTFQTINNYLETTIPTGKRITWTSSSNLTYQFLVYAVMDLTDYVGKTIRFRTDFSASGSNTGNYYIGLCNADGTNRNVQANANGRNGETLSFVVPTLSGQQKYLCVALYVNFAGTLAQNDYVDFTNIMLTIDDSDMTYEEYKGNDYEINLGKNLFNAHSGTTITSVNVQFTRNDDGTITLNGTSNNIGYVEILYAFQNGTAQQSNVSLQLNNTIPYTISVNQLGGTTTTNDVRLTVQYNSSGSQQNILMGTPQTISNSIGIYRAYIRIPSGAVFENLTLGIQIEAGSIKTNYAPYKPPIYLGKIGTYQDYIFRNTTENPLYDSTLEEGQWYIHKEIGRVVLNGSESWQIKNSGTDNWMYYFNASLPIITDSTVNNSKCNYYPFGAVGNSNTNTGYYIVRNEEFRIRWGTQDTVANFKTWLGTHNTEVYYVLNTPTNTLIEDEELINQLNSIELLEGLNNVSVSSANLPFIMNLMYNYQEAYVEEILYFSGVVENTGNISLNPRYPHYCNLQVLDFKTFLSEGETLDFVIYNKTILEAINQVIGTISDYGFILGNVNILHGDDVIGAYSTKDKTAYDVFNYIADITQSRWTTRMIDENTVAIDFYDPTLMPQGTSIEYTQTWFRNNKIQDMSFSYSSRDYRNKQVMLSGEVYANIETTEIIVADGYQTQFNTTGKIGYVSSLLLNGNPATIITKEEYDLGYEGDFIYQPGNTYFESVNLVSAGAIITIVYFAIIEGREVVLNQEEISRVSEMIDRKGVIARYENRNDATTTQELQAIGQSYLKYKGNPEVSLKVETLDNIWNIGERVEFDSPLEELTTEYMVKKKTINYITTQDNIFYTYELSSSFNSETEINYFDNQRSKMMGNIGAGEYISRNIDIENTANVIFYDLEVNEVVIDGDSTLQSELQTPLGVE